MTHQAVVSQRNIQQHRVKFGWVKMLPVSCNYVCTYILAFSASAALTISRDQSFCPAEEDTVWRMHWPDATPGSTQSVRCPGEGDMPGLGLAHRSCLTGGVWGSVDASDCESVAIRDIRIQVGAVIRIEEDKVIVSYII